MNVKELLQAALAQGACDKATATDYQSLARLFFSPQGREFCEKKKFPSLEKWRQIGTDLTLYSIFLDKGQIERTNDTNIAVVGNTQANIIITDNTRLHHIVVMHGAEANVVARNYAVVSITNIDGIVNTHCDSTAKIFQ